jgi:hypothetical protein
MNAYICGVKHSVTRCSPGPALDAMLERGWPVLELDELDIESRAEIVERYISMNR